MRRLENYEIKNIANNMNVELSGNAIQDVDIIRSEFASGSGRGIVNDKNEISYNDAYRILDYMKQYKKNNGSTDFELATDSISFFLHGIFVALAVAGILLVKFLKYPGKWLFIPITAAVTVIISFLSTLFFDFNSYAWSRQDGFFRDLARKLLDTPSALGVGIILLISLALTFLIFTLTKKQREERNARVVSKIGGKTGCYILIGAAIFIVVFSLPVLFVSRLLFGGGSYYANNFVWFWRQVFHLKEIANTVAEAAQSGVIFFICLESLLTILFAVLFLNNRKKLAALVAIVAPVLCFLFYECAGLYGSLSLLERNIIGSLFAGYRILPQEVTYLFGMIQVLCSVMIGVTILCRKKIVYGITRFLLQLVCLAHLITMLFASKSNALGQNHLLKLLYNSVGFIHIDHYKFSNTQIYINASVIIFFVFALCTWVIDMILAGECIAGDSTENSTGADAKRKSVIPWIVAAAIVALGIITVIICNKPREKGPFIATEPAAESATEIVAEPAAEPITETMPEETMPEETLTEEVMPGDTTLSIEEFSEYVANNYRNVGVMPYLFAAEGESLGVISYMKDYDWNTAGLDIVSWDGETVQKLYSGNELNYYAEYADGKIHILYDTKPDYSLAPEMQAKSKEYHVISLENNNISVEEIEEDSYLSRLSGAIWLNNKSHLTASDSIEADMMDYSYELVEPLIKMAQEKGELVLDTMPIKSNGENGIYATLRGVEPDFLPDFMDDKIFSFFDVVFVDQTGAIPVATESLLDEDDPNDGFWDSISSFGCFDLGDEQHYYVEVYGTNEYSTKYLYGYYDGKQKQLLSGQDIYQTENGIFCSAWGESGIINVEVTFDDGEYKEFSSEVVPEEDMRSQFNDFDGINNANLDELYSMEEIYIEGWDECVVEDVIDAHLVDVRRGSNGKYYMTYEYTFVGGYSPEYYSEIEQVCYYTYRVEGNKLIKEEGSEYVNLDRKGNDSRLGLPFV